MKRFLIAILLAVSCSSLFAVTYEISGFDFNVTGKTQPERLSEIVGNTGASFDSIEKLEEYLEEKRQDLLNLRLFREAEFSYEMQCRVPDLYEVFVTFFIHDASSIFVLPYPKYDSNYGFKLGIKAYDKNLWGNLTNLYAYAGFQQQNNSVRNGLGEWEISLSDIRLGNARIKANTYGELNLLRWDRSYVALGAGVSDIKIRDLKMSASTNFKFSPESFDISAPWAFTSVGLSMSLAFLNDLFENFSVSESITYYVQELETDTSTSMDYHMGYDIYSQFEFSSKQAYDPLCINENDYLELGIGIKRNYDLTEDIGFTNRFMFYLNYNYKTETVAPYFDYTITSSLSNVNWIGNFRSGISYSLRMDFLSYLITEIDRNSFKLWVEVCGYLPLFSWIDISSRFSMTLSDRNQYFGLSSSCYLGDYLRGIRLDNPYVYDNATEQQKLRRVSMVFNLDFITEFIEIKDFCKSYAIPFIDIAFINTDEDCSEFKTLTTVGGEGVLILNNHPSYPIRGSLGINAEDLVNYMKGNIGFSDVEFEIFIGMGFFY